MNDQLRLFSLASVVFTWATCAFAEPHTLDPGWHHLRVDGPREWAEFPAVPDAERLQLQFDSQQNAACWTLRLRQQDVKQRWHLTLNGQRLGTLPVDENDMIIYFAIPAGSLVHGGNEIRIEQDPRRSNVPDDIRIGEIVLHEQPIEQVLADATVQVEVIDADAGQPLPARLTICNSQGTLQTPGVRSNHHLAVRPGVIYTSNGQARFHLPAGSYTVFAGRGFEYSLARTQLTLKPGDTVSRTLKIRREVPTDGYVACDTHVHTLTHSGHGDASVEERMVTIAGEGIELPIATDHNVHIDHAPFATRIGVRQYFTPVIGNEVTTRVGHFNIFPVTPGARVPDHRLEDWQAIFDDIYATPDVKIAILNHPRDIHGGIRPFGPRLHHALAGENLAGWPMRFNAVEVINSGATQTDILKPFHDWMALLNRGWTVTPVGSSDSHDVARHFVGQGRTYIQCRDNDPGNIDLQEAVRSFLQGRVMVSYGLLAELTVDGDYRSGAVVPVAGNEVSVSARVLGPSWVQASEIRLYANGTLVRAKSIQASDLESLPRGVKWAGEIELPRLQHDVHLVALALGPGIAGPHWTTAKPYQPTAAEWEARVVGCSGAVWLDVDGDGHSTSAHDYARRLVARASGDLAKLLDGLAQFDRAVTVQAAHLYQASGKSLLAADAQQMIGHATSEVKQGVTAYLNAWRESQLAQSGP